MQRRTAICLSQATHTTATANKYRASHCRYINPSDVGLAAGNRFDPIFSSSALKTATFATTAAEGASATSAFTSLPEVGEFVKHFTAGNTALHSDSAAEHRHHGLEAAYDAITRAEEIFTSLIEHQLGDKTANGGQSEKVSASGVSADIKLQFATLAATKIALLTNHFNHFGSGSLTTSATSSPSAGCGRPPFTDFSHPAMSTRARVKVETEIILTAVKALSLFEVPPNEEFKGGTSSQGELSPKVAAMFPFLTQTDAATAGDASGAEGRRPQSELSDRLEALVANPTDGGFLSGRFTPATAAATQLLDAFAYILSTFTYTLAKAKEIAPDTPEYFNGSKWSVFGDAKALTKAEKRMRDEVVASSPKFFHLIEAFRLDTANVLLRDVIRTYLNVGGQQASVESYLPSLSYNAGSVLGVLRSSCQQSAARMCVTSGLLRILIDGNLVESQKDILRGKKLLMLSHNAGREDVGTQGSVVTPSLAVQAQQHNAAAHALLGQQLLACPLPLLVAEFGQSLRSTEAASGLEATHIQQSGSVGSGNAAYGNMSGDFSTVRHLHNRVNLFSMMGKNDAIKRPVEGGLFLSLNADLVARKSYGTYGPNQMDESLTHLYEDSVEFYRTRVEEDAKADVLSLTASSVLTSDQKALLREQRAAEQDHYASALLAAGNFYLVGTPRPPPATNKQQDTRIWDQPLKQLAYLQSPLISTSAGSDQLFTESSRGGTSGGDTRELPFDQSLKRAQQLLEKALQMTRSVPSATTPLSDEISNTSGNVTNETGGNSSGSSVYNLKAAYILRSLACVYCEMKDYLYATGLFASAERAFVHHYGQHSAEVLDLLALQETYQRRIGATREGEMTFKKMMNVVGERKKNGLL